LHSETEVIFIRVFKKKWEAHQVSTEEKRWKIKGEFKLWVRN